MDREEAERKLETWPEDVKYVFLRDKLTCQYCGKDGRKNSAAFDSLVIDHVIPRCKGGEDDRDKNLVLSCGRCNTLKGRSLPMAKEKMLELTLEDRVKKVRDWLKERRERDKKDRDALIALLENV